ncbi:hypothetical protein INT45_005206 [Circinella minor]|uniref:Uncharacterized protein n=1 Tax=Circinella minor TaxID=1195481 RepID=A0A8H7RRI4_9FUNG|nr:hypothetical protein INT45_005206 [Circinella minor]
MPIYYELPKVDNPIFYSASAAVDYLYEKGVFYHEMECVTCSRQMHLNFNHGANEWRQDYTLGWEAAKKIWDELFDLIEQDITYSLKEEPIDGQGVIVEMDESKFDRTKNNLMGTRVEGVWVFGAVEANTPKR